MKPPDTTRLWAWVKAFLEEYLPHHRGSSLHTVASYRTAFRQLKQFFADRPAAGPAARLNLEALEPPILLEFLGWLESSRGPQVSASTRNLRLAALRSFFRFLELYSVPEQVNRWRRLRQLPFKRAAQPRVDHLELRELEQVFRVIPTATADGYRDLALLALLYNTGARASEVAGLRLSDLRLEGRASSARLHGKGRSVRQCPLWALTAELLARYLEKFRRHPRTLDKDYVFINQRGEQLTRFGVARRVQHYLALAAREVPSLRAKRLSAHSFRHTTAIHLIDSGADIHVVKTWLGHRSSRSTDRYLNLDLEPYREFLDRFVPPAVLAERTVIPQESPDDALSTWLEQL